jgi:hypothetical protein
MSNKIRIAREINRRVIWDFLETLRESGVTNMFGAAPYLMDEFGMDKYQARDALLDWMENYKRTA